MCQVSGATAREQVCCSVLVDLSVSPQDLLNAQQTLPHGHVEAVLLAVRQLGLEAMLSAQPCRERDLVLAMIVQRLLHPCCKLAYHPPVAQHHLRRRVGSESDTPAERVS